MMSARIEMLPSEGRRVVAVFVIAVVLAIALGAASGSLITLRVTHRGAIAATSTYRPWDAQKLAAMDLRLRLAERAGSYPGYQPWDLQKLGAMATRQTLSR